MTRTSLKMLLACSLMVSAVWASASTTIAADHAALSQEIQKLAEKFQSAGLAVVAVKDGEIVYSDTFGNRDVASQDPLEKHDLFRIASISKSFTATALMQLVDAGKISLDDDVSDLIGFRVRNPNFPDKPITLRMLLSHTSSINDSQGYFSLSVINPSGSFISPSNNTDSAKCYNDYAPGERYRYCNLNYNMAGTIIESVTGERFDEYVFKNVLKPLGLNAGYWTEVLDKDKFVTLYLYNGETKTLNAAENVYDPRLREVRNYMIGSSAPIFSPTGGLKISGEDLARYMTMHMNYGQRGDTRILSEASAKEIQTPVRSEYGLGIGTTSTLIPGVTLKGHTGSAYGLASMMFFHPEEKYGFVAISSGSNSGDSEGYNELLKLVVRQMHEKLIADKSEAK